MKLKTNTYTSSSSSSSVSYSSFSCKPANRVNKKNFAFFTRTKIFREMAQINAQQFIDVVAQLLQTPFGSRNIADQRLTVQQPRPMPVLKMETGNRTFQKDWYSKKDLLGGNVLRNSLLCWPCLIFKPGAS